MYLNIRKITVFVLMALVFNANAQQSLTLKQAIDIATKNNVARKNSLLKIEESKKQVKEVLGMGMPQVNLEGSLVNQLQLPVFLFPNPQTGKNEAIRVGNKYNASYTLSASQLLFDGSFFLGVKISKEFVELYNRIDKQTEIEVKFSTAKAYLLCLMTAENTKLIQENISLIEKNLKDAKILYKNGFSEEINVNRLEVALAELNLQKRKNEDGYLITKKLLNLQMGMDITANFILESSLDNLYKSYEMPENLDFKNALINRPDLQVFKQQLTLDSANIKRYKVQSYPRLYAAYNYKRESFNAETIKFPTWYPSSLLALSLKYSLFNGFSNRNKIAQTKIQLESNVNTYNNLLNSVKLETTTAELKYKRSIETILITNKMKSLNKKILDQTNIKHNQGMVTSFDVTVANKDYKNSSISHLNAIYELLVSNIELRKAYGLEISPSL